SKTIPNQRRFHKKEHFPKFPATFYIANADILETYWKKCHDNVFENNLLAKKASFPSPSYGEATSLDHTKAFVSLPLVHGCSPIPIEKIDSTTQYMESDSKEEDRLKQEKQN